MLFKSTLFAAAAALATSVPLWAETITDDVGRSVEVSLPIQRAVIFNRYSVEFARAIGAIDQVVGTGASTYRDPDYWPEFTETDVVGQGQNEPNYEAIIAKNPDLVIMPRNGVYEEAARQLEPFGIPVMVITAWDTLKHVENVELMGKLFGQEEQAADLVDYYVGYQTLLAERLDGVPPVPVYLEEKRPLVTVTPGSGWHDMIAAGGGENVFGDIVIEDQAASRGNVNAFTIDPEEIVQRQPQLIVKLEPGSYTTIPEAQYKATWADLTSREEILSSPAGQNDNVHVINYYLAGGSSKITGALQIAKWAHPELFADIDPEEAMRQWIEDFQGMPYQPGMTYQAGF
ncbi:ABC transporter substrate-binding protein [Ponticoccus alexandrii]|uniref:ABC transporter substrate-binding protein n=1 Tax=Ponticoccus alexandrii TaxID=1943633 RepID=A0ABX7FFP8_9RHOB|nr:ABC transporter substrate-binding protein [Ponticoccus alexandrii]ETA49470.1 Fe3+-hydroxamate ABC transporter substrate-binding protein [Rhodobacteraceae bacterium PD-2]QRF68965.1 ABC transporter substrate-binding protein [Ponticoccus alexandrii]